MRGNRFGTTRQGEEARLQAGQTITVRGALAHDGNLQVAIGHAPQAQASRPQEG